MTTTESIRRWAMALPEVEETSHHLLRAPKFSVRGRTFLGMGRDETTAVLRVSEEAANAAATAHPTACEAVRRRDARRSFLGLQVELAAVTEERVKELIEDAWREQAPKRLAARLDERA